MIRSIAHPTDFSPEGTRAFEHALRIALVNRCKFYILHVRRPDEEAGWHSFPRVRQVLQRWGFLRGDARPEDILPKTGVEVVKVEIVDSSPGEGLTRFLQEHRPDLLVMASRGQAGLNRLFNGSVSAELVRETLVPTLIFGPAARPFVDTQTGVWKIASVLVPVDHDPAPDGALGQLDALVDGLKAPFDFVHVGGAAPVLAAKGEETRPVRTLDGPVVETILREAERASVIAMPMVGRTSFRDTIRGSTTERVVAEVRCPVLVLPVTVPAEPFRS